MIHIGISGSRDGCTPAQLTTLCNYLKAFAAAYRDVCKTMTFHHGDCVGVDAAAHDVAFAYGYKIIVHPPENSSKRAFKNGHIILSEKPYLIRNKCIVANSDIVFILPKDREFPNFNTNVRGGTWYTYRDAIKNDRDVIVIWPNGTDSNNVDEPLPC